MTPDRRRTGRDSFALTLAIVIGSGTLTPAGRRILVVQRKRAFWDRIEKFERPRFARRFECTGEQEQFLAGRLRGSEFGPSGDLLVLALAGSLFWTLDARMVEQESFENGGSM